MQGHFRTHLVQLCIFHIHIHTNDTLFLWKLHAGFNCVVKQISDEKLVDLIRENFDLRPAGIIKMLDLRRPIYKQTAAYGHFGRTDLDLPWEKTDKAATLKKLAKA